MNFVCFWPIFVFLIQLVMNKIIAIACLSLFGFSRNTSADTIYAVVNVDTATIWHKEYHTSCSSSFMMDFRLTDYHINLYEVDTSGGSYCLCYFDLNTEIGGLRAGSYSVDVFEVYWPDFPYFNPGDTTLLGKTSFEIFGNPPSMPLALVGNNTSDCYHNVGIDKLQTLKSDFPLISVNPNPVKGNVEIVLNILNSGVYKLNLLDETGKTVDVLLTKNMDKGIQHIKWDASCLPTGFYIIQLSGLQGSIAHKVIVSN